MEQYKSKKRFWKGSLTWILSSGWGRFKQVVVRIRLFREFAVLNHVDNNPAHYVREGEYHCGIQGCRELEELGWPEWEAQDISSFHHNWYFDKRWRKKTKGWSHNDYILNNIKVLKLIERECLQWDLIQHR